MANLQDVVNQLLREAWLIFTPELPPHSQPLIDNMISHVNAAMQTIWSSDEDHWKRTTVSVILLTSTQMYALDASIRRVLGPMRFASDGITIPRADTRGEFDAHAFNEGRVTTSVVDARPRVYFDEMTYQSGSNPSRIRIFVKPSPAVGEVAYLDCEAKAPNYTRADYCASVEIPIPSEFVESILIPIAHYYAMSTAQGAIFQFQASAMPQIAWRYDEAMWRLLPSTRPQPHQSTQEPAPVPRHSAPYAGQPKTPARGGTSR